MLDKKTLCPFLYQFQPSLEGGNIENFYIRDKNANAGNLHKNGELTTINCESSSVPAVREKSENAKSDVTESDGPHALDGVKLNKGDNRYKCMPTLAPAIAAETGEINFANPLSILSSQPRNPNIYNRNPSGRISLLIEPRPLIQSQQRQQPAISNSKKPKLSPQQPQLSVPDPSQETSLALPPVLIRAKNGRPKLTASASASSPTPVLTTNNNSNSNSRERPSESPRPPHLSPVKPLQGQSNEPPQRQKMVTCLQKRGSEWIINTKKEVNPNRPSSESPPTLTRFDSSTSSNRLGAACVRNGRNASSRYSLRSTEELQKAKDLARLVYVIPHKPPQKEGRKKKSNIFDRPFSPELKLKSATKEEFLNNLNLIPVVREAVIDDGPSPTSLGHAHASSHKLLENKNHESSSSSRAPKLPKNPINDKLGKGKSSNSSSLISRDGHDDKVTSIRHLTNHVGSKISETKSKKKSCFDEKPQTTSLDFLKKSTSFKVDHIIDMDIDLDILDLFVSVDDRNFFTSRGLTP